MCRRGRNRSTKKTRPSSTKTRLFTARMKQSWMRIKCSSDIWSPSGNRTSIMLSYIMTNWICQNNWNMMKPRCRPLRCRCLTSTSKVQDSKHYSQIVVIRLSWRQTPSRSRIWSPHQSSITQFLRGHSASSPSPASSSTPQPEHQANISNLQAASTNLFLQPQAASTPAPPPSTYHQWNILQLERQNQRPPQPTTAATGKQYRIAYQRNICSIELNCEKLLNISIK